MRKYLIIMTYGIIFFLKVAGTGFHSFVCLSNKKIKIKKRVVRWSRLINLNQGRIIHRRDWASALGHQPIGGHQVIKIMTRPLKYFSCFYIYIILLEEMQMHRK